MDSVNVILLNQASWEKYEELNLTNEMYTRRTGEPLVPVGIFAAVGLKQEKLYNVFLEFKQIGTTFSWQFDDENKWIYNDLPETLEGKTIAHSIKHPDGDQTGSYWMNGAIVFDKLQITTVSSKQISEIEIPEENQDQMVALHTYSMYFLSIKISQLEPEQELTFDFTKTEFIPVTQYYLNEQVKFLKIQQRPKTSSYENISRLKRKYAKTSEKPTVKKSALIDHPSSSASSTDHPSSSTSSTPSIDHSYSSLSTDHPSLSSSTINSEMSLQLIEKEIWLNYKDIGNEMLLVKNRASKHSRKWEFFEEVSGEIIDGRVEHDEGFQSGWNWNALKFIDFSLVTCTHSDSDELQDRNCIKLKNRMGYVLGIEIVEQVKLYENVFQPHITMTKTFEETQFITVSHYQIEKIKKLKTDPERSKTMLTVHENKRNEL